MLFTASRFGKQDVERSVIAPRPQIRWHLLARISMLLWAFFLTSWIAQRVSH
ncbi:MAG TPA: hypothetical protein VF021_07210 [Longimicrobiales bacterium]